MKISGINPSSFPAGDSSKWTQLLKLFEDIRKLQEDMKEHPGNAMKDIDQMIQDAKEMHKLAKELPPPADCPHFAEQVGQLVKSLENIRSDYLNDISHNPDLSREWNSFNGDMMEIFHVIAQG